MWHRTAFKRDGPATAEVGSSGSAQIVYSPGFHVEIVEMEIASTSSGFDVCTLYRSAGEATDAQHFHSVSVNPLGDRVEGATLLLAAESLVCVWAGMDAGSTVTIAAVSRWQLGGEPGVFDRTTYVPGPPERAGGYPVHPAFQGPFPAVRPPRHR